MFEVWRTNDFISLTSVNFAEFGLNFAELGQNISDKGKKFAMHGKNYFKEVIYLKWL